MSLRLSFAFPFRWTFLERDEKKMFSRLDDIGVERRSDRQTRRDKRSKIDMTRKELSNDTRCDESNDRGQPRERDGIVSLPVYPGKRDKSSRSPVVRRCFCLFVK